MARVTPEGVQPEDLGGYIATLETQWRDEFGQSLTIDPASPQSQMNGIYGLRLARQDERLVSVASQSSLLTASGIAMDYLVTLLGIERQPATHSTVTATLTGTPGTVVPAGSSAQTAAGAVFDTDSAVTIGTGGTVEVDMSAEAFGPVAAGAGTITEIVTPVAGWASITNAAAATPGRNRETDTELLATYYLLTDQWAQGSHDALRAAIVRATGVTHPLPRIEDNDTAAAVTVQAVSIPANSLLCVVQGGSDSDVGAAIASRKTLGIPTSGTVAVDVTGYGTINFSRVVEVPVRITMTISSRPDFPAQGLDEIRRNLVEHAATWGIGEAIDVTRLYEPILAVQGFTVTTAPAVVNAGNNMDLPAMPALAERYTLTTGNITITVA